MSTTRNHPAHHRNMDRKAAKGLAAAITMATDDMPLTALAARLEQDDEVVWAALAALAGVDRFWTTRGRVTRLIRSQIRRDQADNLTGDDLFAGF